MNLPYRPLSTICTVTANVTAKIAVLACVGLALALAAATGSLLNAGDASAPTPFPDPKNESAWPGTGPIRVFDFMNDNRSYFWTQRQTALGAVVFVGDSLTGNWDAKQMAALFPKLKIANRGIGGDVSRGLLFRLKEDALDLNPKALVVCIGSNDLSAHADPAGIAANIADIIGQARQHNATMPIILCTIAPRNSPVAPTKPGAQSDLNARITKLAAGQQHLALLDLVPVLGDDRGEPVPANYTADLEHLAAPGYERWAAAGAPHARPPAADSPTRFWLLLTIAMALLGVRRASATGIDAPAGPRREAVADDRQPAGDGRVTDAGFPATADRGHRVSCRAVSAGAAAATASWPGQRATRPQ